LASEFLNGIKVASVATLPSASANAGVVLRQGGSLWYSDGSTWLGLGANFETVAKNLSASGSTFAYTGDQLTSITYANGVIKTFTYGADGLSTITLSGDTPNGIALVKTLVYTAGNLTSITYS
jgi:hypothetical protein